LAEVAGVYRPGEDVAGLDRATDFDVRCYLPGDILVKVDRASMAHSLETRAPFLDFELVDFVLGLPAQLRFGKQELKPLLRASCSDLWPESLRGRGKQGFGAPVDHWLRRPDVEALSGRLRDPGHPLAVLLPGLRDAAGLTAQERWTLLSLALWLEQHTACLKGL
jgi:asparagine synthase (glutamine-hydrolysing)